MSIPGVDVVFLRTVVKKLEAQKLHCYLHSRNRAANALVLRFPGQDGTKVARVFSHLDYGCSVETVLKRLEQHVDPDAPSSLSLLFMLKADVADDRWGSQVAFPGGKRDFEDRNDLDAVVHSTYHQIGIPLNSPEFILLGQLPDYRLRSRKLNSEGLATARFVYLHIGEMTPTVKFSPHEVESIQWVKLASMKPKQVQWNKIKHPSTVFIHFTYIETRLFLQDFFSNMLISFPSIPMENGWDLWGITLSSASSLLQMDNRARVDWPMFRVNSFIFQWFAVHPFHLYIGIVDGIRPTNEQILGALALVTVVLTFLNFVFFFIYGFYCVVLDAIKYTRSETAAITTKVLVGGRRANIYEYEGKSEDSETGKILENRQVYRDAGGKEMYEPIAMPYQPEDLPKTIWTGDLIKSKTASGMPSNAA